MMKNFISRLGRKKKNGAVKNKNDVEPVKLEVNDEAQKTTEEENPQTSNEQPAIDLGPPSTLPTNNNDEVQSKEDTESKLPPATPENTWIAADKLFETYVAKHADEDRLFRAQFELIPAVVKSLEPKTEYAKRPEFKEKNRYRNVVTCDESRVVLNQIEDDVTSDYINASFIDGYKQPRRFIAAQGPKDNTVDDFWRMIWEQNCRVLVMITDIWEQGKKKCEKYWPDEGSMEHGKIKIDFQSVEEFGSYIKRIFTVSHTDTEDSRVVTHFQYRSWPDHGVTKTTSEIFRFRTRTFEAQPDEEDAGPVLVHCSAGVGRTGTFISLDVLLNQLHHEEKVDVFNLIVNMRLKRTEMVQSLDQYVLLHKLVAEDQLFGDTDCDFDQFQTVFEDMKKTDESTGNTGLEKQFNLLSNIIEMNGKPKAARRSDRISDKNLEQDLLTYDHSKVFIQMRPSELVPPYYNASIIQGYDHRQKIIASSSPSEQTVEEFWRVIIDNNIAVVVMLTPFMLNEEELCFPYFNSEGASQFGEITVTCDSTSDHDSFVVTRICAEGKERESKPHILTHFRFKGWDDADVLPFNCMDGLVDMIKYLTNHMQQPQTESNKLCSLTHCPDGIGRTGVYVSLLGLFERARRENRIDVFRSVKDSRDYRIQMVRNPQQLEICYECMSRWLTRKRGSIVG